MFVDYSDKTMTYHDLDERIEGNAIYQAESPSLYCSQWLSNALMAMGVTRQEYEHFTEFSSEGPRLSNSVAGYGFHYIAPHLAGDYIQSKSVRGDPLPVITSEG